MLIAEHMEVSEKHKYKKNNNNYRPVTVTGADEKESFLKSQVTPNLKPSQVPGLEPQPPSLPPASITGLLRGGFRCSSS